MSVLEVHQIPVWNDNYVYLAHDPETGAAAVVDPAVAGPVLKAAAAKGWTISHLFTTQHHGDHVGGNMEIKAATGCTIVGLRADDSGVAAAVGLAGAGPVAVFAEMRTRKDNF